MDSRSKTQRITHSLITSAWSYWTAVVAVSVLKLLLVNSYRSTDFEVHRNWLAITHSLPLDKWYYENTSQWTLDYPPLFAYFEWALSQLAVHVDPGMLVLTNLNYASLGTVLFQKATVVAADFVLAYAVLRCSRSAHALLTPSTQKTRDQVNLEGLFALVFLNGGLLLVDHIHFQYNGMLLGILLLSIAYAMEDSPYKSSLAFAVLLNMKHIYLYVAPAYAVYMLRSRVLPPSTPFNPLQSLKSLVVFALVGGSTLALSFGPFLSHVPQILSRLFPFQRGLSHAYWAPNVWALYNTADWGLNLLLKSSGGGSGGNRTASAYTSGLVGEAGFSVLPQIGAGLTFGVTLIAMAPCLYKLWATPTAPQFTRSVILAAWTSFMFGYHVHEKAILNVVIPLSLLSHSHPSTFMVTLVSGTVSLFPLLFTPTEIVLKGIIAVLHFSLVSAVLPELSLRWFEKAYLAGFVGLYAVENLGPVLVPKYPFLPLLIVSDYCFVGIMYGYLQFYYESTCTDKKIKTDKPPTKKRVVSSDAHDTPASPTPSTRVLRKRTVK